MLFGGKSWGSFRLGDSAESGMLFFLFFMACFIFKIHLLNMLISIMRTIFSDRARQAKELLYRDRLLFVLDNWFLIEKVLDVSKLKYLITAFNADVAKQENQMKTLKNTMTTV